MLFRSVSQSRYLILFHHMEFDLNLQVFLNFVDHIFVTLSLMVLIMVLVLDILSTDALIRIVYHNLQYLLIIVFLLNGYEAS